MKRIFIAIAGLTLIMVADSWLYFAPSSREPGHVDGLKLLAATKVYKEDLKRRGLEATASVSLKELISRGLLTDRDVSGFSGMDVSVNLSAHENRPQEVVVRSRLPDGQVIVALADGSVHEALR